MAVYRNIQPSFWSDSNIMDNFTPEDKYLYLYLMTNEHNNLCGCYEISLKTISNETGYSIETINKIICRLDELNVIRYSPETKEILVLNWWKYNWTASEKVYKAIMTVSTHIRNESFKKYVVECIGKKERTKENILNSITVNSKTVNSKTDTDTVTDIDTVSIPYRYGIETEEKPKTKRQKKEVEKKHYGSNKNVLLTDEQQQKLIDRFGIEEASERIEEMSLSIAQYGYKYKDHYSAILNWARRDAKEEEKRSASKQQKQDKNQEYLNWYGGAGDEH